MSEVAGVRISHPDRVIYPGTGITKLRVAEYLAAIGDRMLPHVAGRPLTLVRCPEGIGRDCFFMKHSKVWAPPALRRVRIQEKTKVGDYLIADSVAALVSLAQMGIVEIHTWNSVFEDVERPNRIVFDLDPGERIGWAHVVAAARTMKGALDALELESFVKTTGGRGLHVLVPLRPHANWQACLEFSRALCERIAASDPQRYTTQFARAGRERKILLDYLRNNRTNTSVSALSPRARAGAAVSMPLRWNELSASSPPGRWTIDTAPGRLRRLRSDPWSGYWTGRQRLTRQLVRAVTGTTSAP